MVTKAVKEVGTGQHNFVWAQLHGLADFYDQRAARRGAGPAVQDVPLSALTPRPASRPSSAAASGSAAKTPLPSPAAPTQPETPILENTPAAGATPGFTPGMTPGMTSAGETPGKTPAGEGAGSEGVNGEAGGDGSEPAAPPTEPVDEAAVLDATLRQIDEHVGAVYAGLPPNSMLVVFTGQGDTSGMRKFQVRGSKRSVCLSVGRRGGGGSVILSGMF